MPKCRRYGNNVVNKSVTCQTCRTAFHEGCLARYVITRYCKQCCIKTFEEFRSNNQSRTTPAPTAQRNTLFDTGRDLGNLSFISNSGSSLPYDPLVSSQPQANIENLPVNMANLPLNWQGLSLDDKITQVFCLVTTNLQKTELLTTRIDSLNEQVATQR